MIIRNELDKGAFFGTNSTAAADPDGHRARTTTFNEQVHRTDWSDTTTPAFNEREVQGAGWSEVSMKEPVQRTESSDRMTTFNEVPGQRAARKLCRSVPDGGRVGERPSADDGLGYQGVLRSVVVGATRVTGRITHRGAADWAQSSPLAPRLGAASGSIRRPIWAGRYSVLPPS